MHKRETIATTRIPYIGTVTSLVALSETVDVLVGARVLLSTIEASGPSASLAISVKSELREGIWYCAEAIIPQTVWNRPCL